MTSEQFISAIEFCKLHHIDISFIHSLQEYGLVETTIEEQTIFLHHDQLQQVEQFARLHYELDINIEGIDAIVNLLQKVETMEDEIRLLKGRLRNFGEAE